MADFPISLENIFFTKSIVISLPEHIPNVGVKLKSTPINNLHIHDEIVTEGSEFREFTVTMRTIFNSEANPADPYSIDVECVGRFKASKSEPDEELKKGIMIVAHSVLYGAIRESVSWITSRQAFGALNLGLSILKPAVSQIDAEINNV